MGNAQWGRGVENSVIPTTDTPGLSIQHPAWAPARPGHTIDDVLTDHVLALVLGNVGTQDLLTQASRVNRRWWKAATGPDIWKRRFADRQAEFEWRSATTSLKLTDTWGGLWLALHCRNLVIAPQFLGAPTGGDIFDPVWDVPGPRILNQPNWMTVETPPVGINNHPITANSPLPSLGCEARKHQSAAITSFRMGTLVQKIDLKDRLITAGLKEEEAVAFLRTRPTLRFSVWYGARFDCRAEGYACVAMFTQDPALTFVEQLQGPRKTGIGHPGGIEAYAGKKSVRWSRRLEPACDSWEKVAVDLRSEFQDAGYARIILQGRDLQFWKGYYGIKWHAPQLVFIPAEGKQGSPVI